MNFDYSSEQRQLKDQARRFLSERSPTALIRAMMDRDETAHDPQLWAGIADLGWLGTVIPEALGGLGLGYVELCAIAEELGRAAAPVPFASSIYFFAEALLRAGTAQQQSDWLPAIASGTCIGCFASAEGPGDLAVSRLTARVVDGRLSGVKLPVTDGEIAHVAIVLALEDDLPGLFIADLQQAGVQRERLQSLDGARGIARLSFKAVPAQRLGAQGQGLQLTQEIFDRAAALLAFEQIGGADRCLEMACDYAKNRYAFGRPIAGYQAIKHRLADIYVRNELARSNAYYAAWALKEDAAELPVAAAAARVAASEAYSFASRENVHVHGGIGFTWEADPHLYFRRARQLSLVAGAPSSWKERLVAGVLADRSSAIVSAGA